MTREELSTSRLQLDLRFLRDLTFLSDLDDSGVGTEILNHSKDIISVA